MTFVFRSSATETFSPGIRLGLKESSSIGTLELEALGMGGCGDHTHSQTGLTE
jgi:hypothetical protein